MTSGGISRALASVRWLTANMDRVRLVHASLTGMCEDYTAGHIPSAVCFDLRRCVNKTSNFSNTMPSAEQFETYVSRELGLNSSDHIVIYDCFPQTKPPSAPRLYWLFRLFGHKQTHVLDGGLNAWKAAGLEVDRTGPKEPNYSDEGDFTAVIQPQMYATFEEVRRSTADGSRKLVDAIRPNPEQGIMEGRIPGAIHVPYGSLYEVENNVHYFKSMHDRIQLLNVSNKESVIVTCNAGITAAVLFVSAVDAGHDDVALFDGSYQEWKARIGEE